MYRFLSIISVLIIISTVPIISAEVIRGESTVPDWIKNTAGWWASEQIPDAAFLQGIQYLIKERIIVVEIPTEIDSQAAEEVPGWVKNTVGWWAEDKIHDTTFVSGIQYLISKGIMVVMEPQVEEAKCNFKGKEVVCSLTEKEVVEINDFYMEVNRGNCTACLNWAYVGEKYYFQIETFGENHWNHIDGVTVTAKIISKGGELRHDFGEVTTDDGIYKNSIIIPNMDWYAGNILSVTGTYYGVEKTIEKEFEVFKKSSTSSNYGAAAGSCAHVSPFSVATQDESPQGIAFSKSGTKMFVTGKINDNVYEYTLTGAYCIGTASLSYTFDISTQEINPQGIVFSKSGEKMFIAGSINGNQGKVSEYTLTTAWDISSASFVDSLSVKTAETNTTGLTFSKSGEKMFITGTTTGDAVYEYTLTTAWDISSASFVDSFSVATQDDSPTGIAFSKSGDKMFIVGNQGNDINEYTLTTAWDISSASFVDSFNVNSQDGNPRDIWFDSSGKTMFIVGDTGNDVNAYKLTTAWDVSTASFTG